MLHNFDAFHSVRARYGDRKLVNPLSTSDFGFETLNAAEADIEHDDAEMEQQQEDDDDGAVGGAAAAAVAGAHVNGGAAGKFRKKDKKKGNKKNRKQ